MFYLSDFLSIFGNFEAKFLIFLMSLKKVSNFFMFTCLIFPISGSNKLLFQYIFLSTNENIIKSLTKNTMYILQEIYTFS